MKKILIPCIALAGTLGLMSCERTNNTDDNETSLEEENKAIVDRDTIVTEYEVEETIVEYDTTTRTKTVDAEIEEDRDNQ